MAITFIILLTLTSIMTLRAQAEPSAVSDLAKVKHRFKTLYVPLELDTENPAVKAAIADIDAKAESALSSQITNKDSGNYGSWGKLKERDGDSIYRFALKIYDMSLAWAFSYSKYYRSKKVLDQITAACEYLYPFIEPGGKRSGNWWGWEIGAPMRLCNALILLEDGLPQQTRSKMIESLAGTEDKKGLLDRYYRPYYRGGGANALDVAFNQIRFAFVSGIERYAENGSKLVSTLVSSDEGYTTELGIQDDYSYHFHGHGINMGYGRAQMKLVSRFIYMTSGTKFSLSDKAFEIHQNWFRKFIIFNSYKGRVSPFTVGRSISRDGIVVAPIELEGAMLLYLSEDSTCKDLALSFIQEWYEARPKENFYTVTIADLAPLVEPNIKKAKPMPKSARFYPASDYLACRMGRFYTAVLMSSKRTKAWHSISDENIRGHRSGDGTLVVMTDGHEFDNNIIPTMNWYNLSGVTVAEKVRVKPEHDGHSTVVGGLDHNNTSGMAGMDFVIEDGDRSLEARKSYTVTPSGIAIAGTRIRCSNLPNDKAFHTSLHHCPLREQDNSMVVDGKTLPVEDGDQTLTVNKWMHVRNYGYIFPEPTRIRLRINTSERSYSFINKRSGTDTEHSARFYTLFKNHDVTRNDNSYAVTIIPEISHRDMRKLANQSVLDLKVKTETAHIVDDKATRTRHMYFFEETNIEGYSASRPLFLALSREGNTLYATVQDPSHAGGSFSFGIPFHVTSTAKDVQIKAADNGSAITVVLDKGWPKELTFPVN